MTTTQNYVTMCDTCGERFQSSTMHHLDTEPECGDCQNERLALYIACKWTTPAEPSEPCDHPDDDRHYDRDGLTCLACDTLVADIDTLRDDAMLERAEREDDFRYS